MNGGVKQKLQRNPWFARLSEAHLVKLASTAEEIRWPAGHIIFREGDKDYRFYLVLEGRVALDIYVPARGRVIILTVGVDELFGWSAMLPVVEIRTASARALQDTTAVAFDAAALRALCEEDHGLGYLVYRRLTNVIAGRLTATRLQLLDMYAPVLEEKRHE
jgi:CRP/FNR family transcriptional regulator, cyclic AMP receptor protein